ncbi:MAG: hypothetical protein E6713_02970 [Sporomusaceae bacterium]|nr:hypothetical protein [Sporomusaceae bacterium]
MELTLKLKTMAMRWRDILLASDSIRNFCLDKYGKPPTIFVGVNGRKLPDKKHCPAIFILLGVKTEGADQDVQTYAASISWSIMQNDVMVDGEIKPWAENLTGEVIEFLGGYETDDFGQLIYEVLQTELMDSFPISKVEYNIDTQAYFPQWPGYMIISTDIEPSMGEELEY